MRFLSDLRVQKIEGTTVEAVNVYSNEVQVFRGYNTVVVVMANRPNDSLYFRLKNRMAELYRIGDCVAPRRIDMAILEGNKIGRKL